MGYQFSQILEYTVYTVYWWSGMSLTFSFKSDFKVHILTGWRSLGPWLDTGLFCEVHCQIILIDIENQYGIKSLLFSL